MKLFPVCCTKLNECRNEKNNTTQKKLKEAFLCQILKHYTDKKRIINFHLLRRAELERSLRKRDKNTAFQAMQRKSVSLVGKKRKANMVYSGLEILFSSSTECASDEYAAHHFLQNTVAFLDQSLLKPAVCRHWAHMCHADDHSAQPGESMKTCHLSDSPWE